MRAVDGVEHPAALAVARDLRAFLADHAVAGALLAQQVEEQRLGAPVGLGDDVRRAFALDLGGGVPAQLERDPARGTHEPLGQLAVRVERHPPASAAMKATSSPLASGSIGSRATWSPLSAASTCSPSSTP